MKAPTRVRIPAALAAALALVASGCGRLQPLSTRQALERLNVASTKLYAADGTLIANLHGEINRDIVPLDKMPKHVQNAIIAIEDERFWTHRGVDLRSIMRAFVSNVGSAQSGRLQGGSTLSQQLVKNLYFAKPERTLRRKLVEARVTFQFEQQYAKEKILEMYLNTIYFGRGVYGVQAAARSYFRKDAAELTLAEGAFLAGLIHEPGRYEFSARDTPERRSERLARATARRNTVLAKMAEIGFVNDARARRAAAEALEVQPPAGDEWKYPYFVDMVLRQLGVLRSTGQKLDPRFGFLGDSFEERARNVYRGGLRIYTTLDPNAQSAAEEAVAKVMPQQLTKLSAAMAAVESRTGYIRALVGGRDYYPECDESVPAEQQPNVCRLAKVNMALGGVAGGSGRQPGSSFKPFVLAAALERGVSLMRSFDSSRFEHRYPGGVWKVGNYEGEGGGPLTLMEGTVHSVNAVYAHLEIDGVGDGNALKGASRVADVARRLGIPFATEEELRERCGSRYGKTGGCTPASAVPAIALGAKEVSPLSMASAYATFANEGVHVEPSAIVRIADARGKTLYEADPKRERALPRPVALGVSHVLQQVIQRGTGVRARISRPAAGKTGTSQEWRDAWFAGYTPQLAAVIWVGNPIPTSHRGGREQIESMIPANGYPFRVVGGTFPAMIWQYFMTKALADVPVEHFPAPPSSFFAGQQSASPSPGPLTKVPEVLGRTAGEAQAILSGAGFLVNQSPCLDRVAAEGTVVRQTPAPGVEVPQGTAVHICVAVRDLSNFSPSPGPEGAARQGTVPNVIGQSRARAQSDLQRAGYDVASVRECDPSGSTDSARVWKQSPPGGAQARAGSTVTIWYNPAGCD